MTVCTGLRLGGTVSGSTITGGTSIDGYQIGIVAYDGIGGAPGRTPQPYIVVDKDGSVQNGDWTYRERSLTLNIAAYDRDASGGFTEPDRQQQLEANIDLLTGLVDGDTDGNVILEKDRGDGTTRWISGTVIEAYQLAQGPVFGANRAAYQAAIILRCPHPLWQSKTQYSQVISGATALTVEGNARVGNMTLVFASDSVFTHSDSGDTFEITGSGAATTVDVGARTIVSAGVPADGLYRASTRYWQRWDPGTVNVTKSAGNVTAYWRSQWLSG